MSKAETHKVKSSQISKNDFLNFEQVRRFGGCDMLDPRAFHLTGMSKIKYLFIFENYKSLLEKYRDELQNNEWSTK